jgi:hypothetical protein
MFLAACECFFYISAELEFQGVRADHISASEIGFPIFKHGPQIEKHYVVFRHFQIGRVLVVRLHGISPARTILLCQ